MRSAIDLKISTVPDAYGFLYGTARAGAGVWNVNLLPPLPLWRGSTMIDAYAPDDSAWRVFLDGDEIARTSDRAEAEAAVLHWLS